MKAYELSIEEAAAKLRAGDISSVELTQSCLQRIGDVEDRVKGFITVDEEGALAQAKAADKALQNGETNPLCGIPMSIKDLLAVKDLPMTCGSKMLEKFIAPYNATIVDKLQGAGAVNLGKVTMDEFAMGSTSETCAFGVPQNPWKEGYVAGGSSGGSAVTVAAQECFFSIGTDTGGSIRQPAALCGVVGMKPTYGRVSRYGLTAFASSLDQAGPLCRTVADTALVMNSICGYDPMDSTSINQEVPDYTASLVEGVKGLRIGIPKEYFAKGLDSEVEKVVRNAIAVLASAGAEIVDVSLPHTEYCVAVYYLIAPAEASTNLSRYDGALYGYRDLESKTLEDMYKDTRSAGFGDEVKKRILIGTYALSSGYYDAYYKKASQVRTLIIEDFKNAYRSCDVLLSPVTPTPAWKLGAKSDDPLAIYLSDIMTVSANLAGIPGMSVPGGFTEDGLPVGIQLQGSHFQEEILLKVAYNLEKLLAIQPGKLDF
ncbi:Asp-tRNA(Asn)/Glu-tRNA(Gln) amidotransferase subunit GatA [Desulfotalea psychrophila]|uniref:Glutamyl-tRNA(Gln) amidotransferase subunit A n=1 Tax=Desulfotalea psychrophila (strain LSv54 / DSM 12343) TaxID=177439 RepID=GATA_DESPS|nr:Asp-tRNA(Asn)/Glu-tRNA(Gln) amidotransferase subunit GatA [Desulfotalea psychrophila]Q6AQK1.1 RecName: Full=Glutamyl-tRNA(Gln) amidotransferase subunit A; Short=Glu-ADT subunit A [Desulfotalea psychrophila LSv54]CAG35372.1 probable glutamyl-tRNA(Gln) amidotransferase, subunit A [Desulfotalea psychrophila LSv54]